MTDIQINNEGHVVMQKVVWSEAELVLAKCFNMSLDIDTGIITAFPRVTSQKPLTEFIKSSFKNFSESEAEQEMRDHFYLKLAAIYGIINIESAGIGMAKLPYWNKLYKHQADVIVEAFPKKHNFLAMEMGTGKTLVAASLSRMRNIRRTLIVTPNIVKWTWHRELTNWGFNELYFTIYDASKYRCIRAFQERFIIINYDITGKFEEEICRLPVDSFILDEVTDGKNHNTNKFKNIKKIIDRNPDAPITMLSGTPVKNRVNDVYAYMKLIGHELGSSHKKFLDDFTVRTTSRGGVRVTGGKNLNDLYLKMSNFMIRKTKAECLDLPEKIYLSYRFELDDYKAEYDLIVKQLAEQKEYSALSGCLHSLNILTSKAKIKGIKALADDILQTDKKAVIFGSYREPINKLEEYFGDKCVKIDGSVESYKRDQLIQRFHNDETCTVFLGNMAAAGMGINLTNSSDVIFLNFPLTPAELYQAQDRLHRIGQKNSVNIHYTFCDDSIDEHIHAIIVDKEKDIVQLIDQGTEVVTRESMTDILIKKILHIPEDQALPHKERKHEDPPMNPSPVDEEKAAEEGIDINSYPDFLT